MCKIHRHMDVGTIVNCCNILVVSSCPKKGPNIYSDKMIPGLIIYKLKFLPHNYSILYCIQDYFKFSLFYLFSTCVVLCFFLIENTKQFAGWLLLCEFFANYCAANFAPAPRQDEFEPSELSAPPLLLSPCGSFRLGLNEFYWIRHLLYFFFWWQVKSLLLYSWKRTLTNLFLQSF